MQRIQTVWLLVVAALAFLTLRFSFYSGTHLPENMYKQLNGTGIMPGPVNILLIICTVALGLLALINIFLFKTRIIQLRLCIAAIVLDALVVFLYIKQMKEFSQGDFAITAGFHIIIVVALILAARGINKDEKLIRDSNRLR